MQVAVPPGVTEGMPFQAMTPNGPMMVTVPPGIQPGQMITISVPQTPAPLAPNVRLYPPTGQPIVCWSRFVFFPLSLVTCCAGPVCLWCCVANPATYWDLEDAGTHALLGARLTSPSQTSCEASCNPLAGGNFVVSFNASTPLAARRDMVAIMAYSLGNFVTTPRGEA